MRFIVALLGVLIAFPAMAGKPLPIPPNLKDIPALQKFADETKAEIDYVSRQYGVDMWVITKGEIAQIVYTTPDGQGLLMNGFLFAPDGSLVTEQSMKDYAEGNSSIIREKAKAIHEKSAPQTPSAKLWSDLEKANYVEFGSENAPVLYTFVDPYCPHCKLFWSSIMAPYIQDGNVKLRLVPVGILGDKSAQAAAYIVNSEDRAKAWLDLTSGKLENIAPIDDGELERIAANFKVMQRWKMASTPFSVYKDGDGKVKMYRGNPNDMATLIAELSSKAQPAE